MEAHEPVICHCDLRIVNRVVSYLSSTKLALLVGRSDDCHSLDLAPSLFSLSLSPTLWFEIHLLKFVEIRDPSET